MEYKRSLIAFLDVMGFREIIKSGEIEKVQNYISISESIKQHLEKISVKQEIKFISFSDSVAVCLDVDGCEDSLLARKLANFVIALQMLQGELAEKDVWIRGGVSIGDVHFDEEKNIVFGPAFIEAYDLESKYAKYPRIILDQKFIEILGCQFAKEFIELLNKTASDNFWPYRVLYVWRLGKTEMGSFRKDYPLFIDYLAAYTNHEQYKKLESFALILRNASIRSPVAYEKFRWVGDYLALSVQLANSAGPTKEELNGTGLFYSLGQF